MAFYFSYHPFVNYDIEKNGTQIRTQNPLVRFKIKNLIKDKIGTYYTHNMQDHESAQFVAHKYYNDITLDWLIYIANDIIDPQYDWPLTSLNLLEYIKSKYGNIPAAQQGTHHYEQILSTPQKLYNGSITKEKTLEIDLDTYNAIGDPKNKRLVSNYDYETKKNDDKRLIKVIRKNFLSSILSEHRRIFK
jgi:hypothetical protein